MDTGFFGSKYFVISGVIAALIVLGAAAAYTLDGVGFARRVGDGCDAPELAGGTLAATPATQIEDNGERRVVTYQFPAGAYAAGALDACSPFGEVVVDPALDDSVEVRFVITSRYAEAVEDTNVLAEFRDEGGSLIVGAWVDRIGETTGAFGNSDAASIRMEIRVPDTGAWDVRAHSSAGDVHVTDIMAGAMDLHSSFGNVVATGVDLSGDAMLDTSAGDVILSLASVQSGRIEATSSFGNVDVELPARADVGYDVVGETSFGEVTIRIGATESYDSDGTAGERETARTAGYDTKPTQVAIVGTSSAGDVRIVASGAV